ncbi:MAG: HPr family phosphocarrier protein [Tepidibacter sp.]|uniref:HPr family phosphocarrier protein n=1 Tax=Tepidibacter sp. TaxID=2529387 RepID=UPI0025D34406|nr:HPr family phosphocarrier protein [Tepidibacter sp.]MCT4509947.1 HPr family phosphocarrier protein [Tepidibacter sp.]
MVQQSIVVKESNGLHARPAGAVVKTAGKFECLINILYKQKKTNAKSIMGVMSLGVREGEEITIEADGVDEKEALKQIIELVKANFEI